jgi:hypothetical protein
MLNLRVSVVSLVALLSALSACDGGADRGDAGGALEDIGALDVDAGEREDAALPEDAAAETRTDAGAPSDPLGAEPTCTSGRMWTLRDRGSPLMHPGRACIECHRRMGVRDPAAARMTIAGTVFPTGHEPDDCNGAPGTSEGGLTVEVTDAMGRTVTMSPNGVGNFSSTMTVTPPLTALVRSSVATRRMVGEVTTGDCNGCHTQTGATMAPGRITIPVAGLPPAP